MDLDDDLGVYIADADGESWSTEVRRHRLLHVASDGTRTVNRYTAIERDQGVLLVADEPWWLITEGDVRFLLPDVARTAFCLAHTGRVEPVPGEFGFWLRAGAAGAEWAPPTAPAWLVDCLIPRDASWSGQIVASDPSALVSNTGLVTAHPSDHAFVPAPVVACVGDAQLDAVFVAIGQTDQRGTDLRALAVFPAPLPVGTPITLRPSRTMCPNAR